MMGAAGTMQAPSGFFLGRLASLCSLKWRIEHNSHSAVRLLALVA